RSETSNRAPRSRCRQDIARSRCSAWATPSSRSATSARTKAPRSATAKSWSKTASCAAPGTTGIGGSRTARSRATRASGCARMKWRSTATRGSCARERTREETRMNVMSDPRREHATRVKPDPIDQRGRAYPVVDTAFHILPVWSELRKYMKEPFKSELTSYPLAGGDYSPQYAIGLEGTGQETQGRARTDANILRVIDDIASHTVLA